MGKLSYCLYSYHFQHPFRTCFGKVLFGESKSPNLQDRIFGRVLDSLLKLLWTNLLELATMFRAIIRWKLPNPSMVAFFPNFLGLQTGSLNNLWRTRSGYLWPGFCEVSIETCSVGKCSILHSLVHRLQFITLQDM